VRVPRACLSFWPDFSSVTDADQHIYGALLDGERNAATECLAACLAVIAGSRPRRWPLARAASRSCPVPSTMSSLADELGQRREHAEDQPTARGGDVQRLVQGPDTAAPQPGRTRSARPVRLARLGGRAGRPGGRRLGRPGRRHPPAVRETAVPELSDTRGRTVSRRPSTTSRRSMDGTSGSARIL
jgi:hypothetical protein